MPHGYVLIRPHRPAKSSKFPDLYFAGTCNGMHGNDATVNGSVNVSDDGVVRWRFVSRVHAMGRFFPLARCYVDYKLIRQLFMTVTCSGALKEYK
jgi:hypothetical protein